ncbi:MAG: TrbG/VirB9 family P-type conjugative transfer protein, partial [Thermoleophilia bacterium]|nr:TrbG/VirB9 family P-type conjugative transfer protein [Acetobacteraceae bacterium]MBY0397879.1 TrbG/VirB9 family P-type conjugative transfer protein [Thermoleophilia bacterium]
MRNAVLPILALLSAAPAVALETPRACSAADPRVRCIAYDPTQVVRLYAATGAALTVEFSEAETIVDASTSDNGLLEGGDASTRQAVAIAETGGGGAPGTADRNLMMAKRGSFLFLKPLRPLLPQPITVLTRREDGRVRRYTFQLETRPGGLTEETPNTFYAVRFTYPADEAAARQARAQADR